MALAIDQLPDDVATLKRLLVERDAEVARRLTAHFSDRGRPFRADRGRGFNVIVDDHGSV
jgi:hypothetical protein